MPSDFEFRALTFDQVMELAERRERDTIVQLIEAFKPMELVRRSLGDEAYRGVQACINFLEDHLEYLDGK